jgi:hypothetical protein
LIMNRLSMPASLFITMLTLLVILIIYVTLKLQPEYRLWKARNSGAE